MNQSLARRPGESDLQYHKRLVYGKLVDKTLSDTDFAELAEFVYGQQYSSDSARKMLYGSRKTLELIDDEAISDIKDGDVLSGIDEKMAELRIERQKFYDQRNAYNKMLRDRSRQEELNEIISSAVKEAVSTFGEFRLDGDAEDSASRIVGDNDILVSLNDMHYGASHANFWDEYNSDKCKKMMEKYTANILEIAKLHKSENCIIWENGDVISGSIHRSIQVTNKENVIQQITGASELISNFIYALSPHFKTVRFVSVAGNHSRLDPNKENALLDERLDDLVEWYLKARLQNLSNVIIGESEDSEDMTYAKIDSTMYLLNIRGKNYCGVHGDFDGSPGRIQALQTMVKYPLYAVLYGHLHHNKVDTVQGTKTVMAGSFLGMDDYCVQKRIYGKPEQLVCICDEDGIRCHYDISL